MSIEKPEVAMLIFAARAEALCSGSPGGLCDSLADALEKVAIERVCFIRERDAARARVAELEADLEKVQRWHTEAVEQLADFRSGHDAPAREGGAQ
jgi:hypothetical protein